MPALLGEGVALLPSPAQQAKLKLSEHKGVPFRNRVVGI